MELLEAALEYASTANGTGVTSDDRAFQKYTIQLRTVCKDLYFHNLTGHIKDQCDLATQDLLDAQTAEEAQDAIARGANVNAPGALHVACAKGFADVLISHPDLLTVDTLDANGKTPLECACADNDLEVMAALLDASAAVNRHMPCGCTVLHHAVDNEEHSQVVMLLGYGADVGAQDNKGNTPLHVAVQRDDLEMVDTLLVDMYAMRPVDFSITNNNGYTVAYLAIGSDEMLDTLLDAGATPDLQCLRYAAARDHLSAFDLMMHWWDQGTTPVDIGALSRLAADNGNEDTARAILEWID